MGKQEKLKKEKQAARAARMAREAGSDAPQGPASSAPGAVPAPKAKGGGGSIARNAGAASAATMLSRVTGLVREQAIAFLFGAGAATDAYNVAFRIPNLLRDLFAEGALNASFTPTFSASLATEGREKAFGLQNRVAGALMVILGLLTLLGVIFAPQVVGLIASGMLKDPAQAARTILLTRILMPFLLAIALAAVAMGALNSLDHFFLPALAPVMLNVGSVVIGGGLAITAHRFGFEPIVGLAIGTMAGGILQWLCQLPPLWREGYRFAPKVDFSDPGVRSILKLMAPATLANGTTQINVLFNTQIASYLVEGSISWLSFAFRLMQLPIGIFGVALGQASQPKIAKALAQGKPDTAAAALNQALALVFVCTIPATVILMVLARPIIGLIYQWRSFSAASADQTAAALWYYAIGLAAFSAVKVLAPAYYALKDTAVPVRASICAVVLNIITSYALMGSMGHRGLALATSLNGIVNMALLLYPMSARLPRFSMAAVGSSLVRVTAASLGMGLACHVVAAGATAALGTAGPIARFTIVMLSLSASVITLVPLLKLCGVPEVNDALSLLAKRLQRYTSTPKA